MGKLRKREKKVLQRLAKSKMQMPRRESARTVMALASEDVQRMPSSRTRSALESQRTAPVWQVVRSAPGVVRVWRPSIETLVEVAKWNERTVLCVQAKQVSAMLTWLAPALLELVKQKLTTRGVHGRGGSIILTNAQSSSMAHSDDTDSWLLNLSGTRTLWLAHPDAAPSSAKRSSQPPWSTFNHLSPSITESCHQL
jgi:hypothetical protein